MYESPQLNGPISPGESLDGNCVLLNECNWGFGTIVVVGVLVAVYFPPAVLVVA